MLCRMVPAVREAWCRTGTLPASELCQLIGVPVPASWTHETIRPAACGQIVLASFFGGKLRLELAQGLGLTSTWFTSLLSNLVLTLPFGQCKSLISKDATLTKLGSRPRPDAVQIPPPALQSSSEGGNGCSELNSKGFSGAVTGDDLPRIRSDAVQIHPSVEDVFSRMERTPRALSYRRNASKVTPRRKEVHGNTLLRGLTNQPKLCR